MEKINNPQNINSLPGSTVSSMELTIVENFASGISTEWGGMRSWRKNGEILDILLLSRKEKSRWLLEELKTGRVKRVGVCTCDRLPTTCLQTCPEETINKTILHAKELDSASSQVKGRSNHDVGLEWECPCWDISANINNSLKTAQD